MKKIVKEYCSDAGSEKWMENLKSKRMKRSLKAVREFLIISFLMVAIFIPKLSIAYRPFITEDAGVAGSGVAQLEVSYDYIRWDKEENEGQLLFVPIYGLGEWLEFSMEIPYLFHNFSDTGYVRGGGDINLVGKLLVLRADGLVPAFTLKGVAKTDTGDKSTGLGSGYFDYSIAGVFTEELEKLILHANLGYTFIGHSREDDVRDIYLYGAGVDYSLFDNFH